ncbi:MAG: alpha/beta hydrolase [Blautia sp.]|nr:alpha/beta hydrolase [Blautia sp.]MCM1201459.1 alpha/beta hydrolase [Bacteroides fragilis]
MIYREYPIRAEGSTKEAKATAYLISHSDAIKIQKRPLIIICPGGGYRYVSDREGEMIALQWNAYGYHAVVLRYSVAPAVYPTALTELAMVMKMVKDHSEEWHVDTSRILVEGSSAGGHLAASFGMFWKKPFLAEKAGVASEELRPAGMILHYPVITSGEYAHRDSFRMLLGEKYEELKDEVSLEHQVSEDTPPAFLWHTNEDQSVPAENSLLLALAMRRYHIPVELHLYAKGGHGLSLADERTMGADGGGMEKECTSWVALAETWMREALWK